MIALIGWTFATAFFAAWVIVAIGGQQQRAELIKQRDSAMRLAIKSLRERDQARALIHPSGRLAPVADVVPIRKGGEG